MGELMVRQRRAQARFYREHERFDFGLVVSGSNSCAK